jgi:hypothetical protein
MHGYFDIDAKVILPFVKISHEKKDCFGKFIKNETFLEILPQKCTIFGKFYHETRYFQKIYHFMEIFPWK